jgi:superoxide reductase
MDRREAIKKAMWGGALIMLSSGEALAKVSFPDKVDEDLWQGINRIKNPSKETTLEKLHSPVIHAPGKVKAGEIFTVDVAIGKIAHPMGPSHWIEYLQLNLGNEPVGNIVFRSHGYAKAAGKFDILLDNDLKGRTVPLIVQIKCNLHGVWQSQTNVEVA